MLYDKNKNVSLLWAYIPIKYLPEGKKILCSLIAHIIKEGDCSDAWTLVSPQFANGSSHIKVIYLINPTGQCHMLTHSEPRLLSRLCIDSLTGFKMSVMRFIIQMLPFMK